MTLTRGRSLDQALVARVADPDFWAGDPYPTLARLRAEAPVAWCDQPGFWAVSSHADVLAVSRDPHTFCSARGVLLMDLGREMPDVPGALLYVDPPEHARYRALVNPGFSTSRIRRLEGRIRERARTLLDTIPPDEPVDVVERVTVPYPLAVIAELLGVDPDDWRRFYAWSDAMIAAATEMTDETLVALTEMATYFLDLVARRRADAGDRPGTVPDPTAPDDLVTWLCRAEMDGRRLGDDELMMFYGQLLVAGNETTRNLLSAGLVALADRPDEWDRLRGDPDLIPRALEELLRYTTPVISFLRTATRDVELGGEEIAAGDPLLLLYTSANRDESVFGPTAGELDVFRDPNPHVAFGFGEHFCLGAALARLEGRVFLEELIDRFADIERAGPVHRLASGVIAGVTRADLRFHPAD